jgi:hypothetical protein
MLNGGNVKNKLRFFWNGIKGTDGKLQSCFYSDGALLNSPAGTITIYARNYRSFSAEIRESFDVQNDSDMMTDYFEQDRIRVTPEHPLYLQVKIALVKREMHYAKRFQQVA